MKACCVMVNMESAKSSLKESIKNNSEKQSCEGGGQKQNDVVKERPGNRRVDDPGNVLLFGLPAPETGE